MDASIIGKAITPISHERLLQLPYGNRANDWNTKRMPISKRYADLKSLQIYHDEIDDGQFSSRHDPAHERTVTNLSPIFRNMSLSETYNFARAQLQCMPYQKQRKRTHTPILAFPKVDTMNKEAHDTNLEVSKYNDMKPSSLSETLNKPQTSTRKNAQLTPLKVQRRAKSVTAHRRHRKSSTRRKKNVRAVSRRLRKESSKPANEIAITPVRTSTSFPSKLNAAAGNHRGYETRSSVTSHSGRPGPIYANRDILRFRPLRPSTKKDSFDLEANDPLLSSLDMSTISKKGSRELSTRIQLIHRYGNEDVIQKHMEMKKKREMVVRLETRVLEQQANERKKEKQRLKIYALNKLMTKLELEQFEEFKRSL